MLNLNDFFSNTKQAILVIQKNGKILELNKNLLDLLGYKDSEIIGINLFQFVYQESERYSAIDDIILRGTFLEEQSIFISFKSKSDLILRVNFLLFHSVDKILCLGDLTSTYAEVKELLQKSFQEILNQVKRNFIENYDLHIRENLQELVLNSLQIEQEKEAKNLQNLFTQQNKTFNKVFRILDIFRKIAEADELENFYIQKIDVIKALREDLVFFQAIASSKKLSFEFSLPTDSIYILANETLLTQVFSFVIDNSIKYTEKGKIKVEAKVQDNSIKIIFADTGIGINNQKLSKIFDEDLVDFSKKIAINSENPRSLCIAKKYLEILQGKIYVESEVNKGSEFSILIPIL